MELAKLQTDDYLTFEAYLEAEEMAEERHEYVNGSMFAMAGATEQHEIVALNLASALVFHLRGKGCRVFKGDMKVRLRIEETELGYYPDIVVVCDPTDNRPLYKERPRVIVEVMSNFKSDHVEKRFAYQHIAALEEYVVVNQNPDEARAWTYRSGTDWKVADGAPNGVLRIDSLDFEIPLEELYKMG